ncbi:MAG TPA: biotin-dependent carboxyltransferase family protein [Vicinamibacterales bacterium]|nr:biotin-dependent carboxyltransferase family protein [Vicinamibacterales bacterium]
MRGIAVIRAGLLTTVQDGGRWGLQHLGVPVAGPMDPFSMAWANLLVGNAAGEAAIEATLLGPELLFEQDTVVAITGADLSATVRQGAGPVAVPLARAIELARGAVLRFGEKRSLSRAYIAVRGGVDVPVVLGSRATSLQAGLPGLAGRPLRTGDALAIGDRAVSAPKTGGPALKETTREAPAALRFVWGPDRELLADTEAENFLHAVYFLSTQSNRMGYRLEGPSIGVARAGTLLSEATPMGTIQVPPSGQPIVLMADRQTTGGYPRIGSVITADFRVAGQLAPADQVRFVPCDMDEATRALREEQAWLAALAESR